MHTRARAHTCKAHPHYVCVCPRAHGCVRTHTCARSDFSQLSAFKFFLMFYFIFERETERKQGWGRERGRHGIRSRLQAPSCQHRAQRGAQTREPQDHDLSRSRPLNRPSHPGAPSLSLFLNVYLFLKERETGCEWGRGRERGRHRIRSRFQALSCQHRARRGFRPHEP